MSTKQGCLRVGKRPPKLKNSHCGTKYKKKKGINPILLGALIIAPIIPP